MNIKQDNNKNILSCSDAIGISIYISIGIGDGIYMSVQYLQDWWIDTFQNCSNILLGHALELISFWCAWHFFFLLRIAKVVGHLLSVKTSLTLSALRMAKSQWYFCYSECSRINLLILLVVTWWRTSEYLEYMQTFLYKIYIIKRLLCGLSVSYQFDKMVCAFWLRWLGTLKCS